MPRSPRHRPRRGARRFPALEVAGWLAGAWLLARPRHLTHPAPEPTTAAGGIRPRVSVLVPARNEEASLPRLLASLAAQDPAAYEVIVVDDASDDSTGELARAAGAVVLDSAGPPPGWSGKCWALHQGQARATGELLVFLDADVTLSAGALGRLAAEHARAGGAGIVSVGPYHRTERPYEQLSAVCNVVAIAGSGTFTGPPRRPAPMAYGPCLVIDRATYDLVGGHAHPSVRSKITEDLALARLTAAAGRPVAVFAGRGSVEYRMYPEGIRQLVDGWTKMLATGAGATPLVAAAAVVLWVGGGLVAATRGARALRPGRPARARGADALAYGAWAAQMGWLMRGAGSFGPLTAAAFPLPLGVFAACFARSAVKIGLGQPLRWRGRSLTGR